MSIEQEHEWMVWMARDSVALIVFAKVNDRSPVGVIASHERLRAWAKGKRRASKTDPGKSNLDTKAWQDVYLKHKLAAEEQRRRLAIYQHDAEAIALRR